MTPHPPKKAADGHNRYKFPNGSEVHISREKCDDFRGKKAAEGPMIVIPPKGMRLLVEGEKIRPTDWCFTNNEKWEKNDPYFASCGEPWDKLWRLFARKTPFEKRWMEENGVLNPRRNP